jgi:hypothetical protein
MWVYTQSGPIEGRAGVFNPWAINGLKAVASQSADYSYADPTLRFNAIAHAAAYGSDSWRDGTGNPAVEALQDLGVEPMADARAHCFSTFSDSLKQWSSAAAQIRVAHRVVARAFPPELKETLEALSIIPVTFQLKLHVSVQGPVSPVGEAFATAAVESQDHSFGYSRDLRVNTEAGPFTAETNVMVNFTVRRHRTNEVHTYWLTAEVQARAWSFDSVSAEAQAVADPLLEVNPDWQYAPYFTVVQESIQHPGEWIEITRGWENIRLRPRLTLTRTNSALKLSWPADAGDFGLQAATNLTAPVVWGAVTNAPVLATNGQWQVALPDPVASQRFYRLLSR